MMFDDCPKCNQHDRVYIEEDIRLKQIFYGRCRRCFFVGKPQKNRELAVKEWNHAVLAHSKPGFKQLI